MSNIRNTDGEPWEVATQASSELDAALRKTQTAVSDFIWAAKGAWMSQEFAYHGSMPDESEWADTAVGRQVCAAQDSLHDVGAALKPAYKAASNNPHGS